MFNQITKSISDYLKERISSPILVSFTVFWAFTNWKILYILFGSEATFSLEKRIIYIDTYLVSIDYNYKIPIILTTIFVFLYPFISLIIIILWSWVDSVKNNFVNSIYKNKLLSLSDSIALREQLSKNEEKLSNLLNSKDLEISLLKAELNKNSKPKKMTLNQRNSKTWDIDSFITKIQTKFKENLNDLKFILQIASTSNPIYHYSFTPEQAEIISYLVSNEIIVIKKEKNEYYELTEKGKQFVSAYLDLT